jgi:hypothetical protein
VLHNGDGLCYWDLQKELVGVPSTAPSPLGPRRPAWRVFPKDPMAGFKDLRKGTAINRNRDMDWVRTLEKKSSRPAHRRVGCAFAETPTALRLTLTDEDGHTASADVPCPRARPRCRPRPRPACATAAGPLWRARF